MMAGSVRQCGYRKVVKGWTNFHITYGVCMFAFWDHTSANGMKCHAMFRGWKRVRERADKRSADNFPMTWFAWFALIKRDDFIIFQYYKINFSTLQMQSDSDELRRMAAVAGKKGNWRVKETQLKHAIILIIRCHRYKVDVAECSLEASSTF